jgi:hypothetical protein
MSYPRRRYQGRQQTARGALVTPRQAAALDRMAEVHGFASGSALLADLASCSVAELARKSRPVVQMFVDQAFTAYGRAPVQAPPGADLRAVSAAAGPKYAYTESGARMTVSSQRCIDAPCCGCCD